ncbi:MAG: hypothetical protein MSIBF_04945 [Candidatus Altiarchaeales archaeon IMC4]|nr:MAG: hypothetical protein MSIBF_04945 [Candidatus Altiarchaeales archaeon IMC4]
MKLKPLKRKQVIRKLKKLGYEFDRSASKHYEIWWHPTTRKRLPVPNYNEFGIPLLQEICGELKIRPSDFMEV